MINQFGRKLTRIIIYINNIVIADDGHKTELKLFSITNVKIVTVTGFGSCVDWTPKEKSTFFKLKKNYLTIFYFFQRLLTFTEVY